MLSTMPTVLTERQGELWRDERRLLERLLSLLSRWETSADELGVLRQALAQLDELFLLVIAGEFNSGKTALINALLGERYLAEGVTPTRVPSLGAVSQRTAPPAASAPPAMNAMVDTLP